MCRQCESNTEFKDSFVESGALLARQLIWVTVGNSESNQCYLGDSYLLEHKASGCYCIQLHEITCKKILAYCYP